MSQHFELSSNGALMTDQCTDQCVVITCHDPDHIDGIPCDSLYGDLPSSFLPASNKAQAYLNCIAPCPGDSVCFGQSCTSQCSGMQGLLDATQGEQGNGCGTDCNPIYHNECADCVPAFLDDIFQCCAEVSAAGLPPASPGDLDAAAVDNTSFFWNQPPLRSGSCLEPPSPEATSRSQTLPEQPYTFSPSTIEKRPVACAAELTTCQWGNCQASFPTSAELVEHVNLCHLSTPIQTACEPVKESNSLPLPPPPPPPPISIVPSEGNPTDALQFSCQWRNCSEHPPMPKHTYACPLPYEQWRDFIAVHVFKDHLGLPPDIGNPTTLEPTPGEEEPQQGDVPNEPPVAAGTEEMDLDILSTPSLSPSLSSMAESVVDPIPRISLRTPLQEPDDKATSSPSPSSDMDVEMPLLTTNSTETRHRCMWRKCKASFETCEELTAHLSGVHVGSGRPIYECFWEGCVRNGEAGFGSKQKVNRHLQSHTGHRPFQCGICRLNFSEAATLQQHIRRHTREKPYVCDYPGCSKSFAIAGALTIHKRTHNGQRPFKCLHCGRAFAESSNLSKHLRTHTGEKPYSCPEEGCSKLFARPDQLNRHRETHRRRARHPDGFVKQN